MKTLPFAILSLLIIASCSSPGPEYPGSMTTDQALQAFQIRDGFRVELFAAEPQIADPVELIFDEYGRAYVVEMPEYPYPPKGPEEHRSRIRLLEDTDGDGQIDRSIIFADSLREATSVMPWKGDCW